MDPHVLGVELLHYYLGADHLIIRYIFCMGAKIFFSHVSVQRFFLLNHRGKDIFFVNNWAKIFFYANEWVTVRGESVPYLQLLGEVWRWHVAPIKWGGGEGFGGVMGSQGFTKLWDPKRGGHKIIPPCYGGITKLVSYMTYKGAKLSYTQRLDLCIGTGGIPIYWNVLPYIGMPS